ncbi:MAG: hypothetical protein NVSMB4_21280 [Acidimicrobiales bacterium]
MADGAAGFDGSVILKTFSVEGFVRGDRVHALYTNGYLMADAALVDQARVGLLVDEVFGDVGRDGAARWLVVLARALDQLICVTFDLCSLKSVYPAVPADGCG